MDDESLINLYHSNKNIRELILQIYPEILDIIFIQGKIDELNKKDELNAFRLTMGLSPRKNENFQLYIRLPKNNSFEDELEILEV